MQYRKLGASGIEASVVGLGTWTMGGWMWGGADRQESIRAIQTAIEAGVNLIDTAPAYGFGFAERLVGEAIKPCRDKVVLSTKCGLVWDKQKGEFFFYADDLGISSQPASRKVYRYLDPASIREELEASLQRLQTDRIDVYHTHWQDPTTPISETMGALEDLKRQGKIRAIAVSNASREHLAAYGPIDADQEQYSMLDRQIETNGVLEYCRTHNIAMLAYSPLGQGLLTGKIGPERTFNEGDQRLTKPRFSVENRRKIRQMLDEFQPIAGRHGISLSQLAIAWTFSQPGMTHVLCGARTPEQAQENASAGDVQLAADEIQRMNEIIARHAIA